MIDPDAESPSDAAPGQRLLIDVTRTLDSNLHTGIQRVVRGLYAGACQWSARYPGPSVHAVRCVGPHLVDVGSLPAHPLEMAGTLPLLTPRRPPRRLQPRKGDVLLLADASWYGDPWSAVDTLLNHGGEVAGFVHDLLPSQHPDWFGANTGPLFCHHLQRLLAAASQLFVSSEHVARQLRPRLKRQQPVHVVPLASSLSTLTPAQAPMAARARPFFLSVATLEPRKNHSLILDAFEALWDAGFDADLLLVGAEGWRNSALIQRVREHRHLGQRLHWLRDINDAQLISLYREAQALLYLPDDEGFGLPVLEARQLGCPVLASDIPPLREAGGSWPHYLPCQDSQTLTQALTLAVRETRAAKRPRAHYTGRSWSCVAGEMLQALAPATHAPLALTGTGAQGFMSLATARKGQGHG